VVAEGVSAFVDLISAKGGLVSVLRILHRRRSGLCLLVSIHDLDRHVAIARVDKQSGTLSPVNFPVCTFLFEPGQPPRSDKPVLDTPIENFVSHDRGYSCRSRLLHSRPAALWEDLSREPDRIESPKWHQDILKETESRVESGEATFSDWEKAKASIRDRLK